MPRKRYNTQAEVVGVIQSTEREWRMEKPRNDEVDAKTCRIALK